MQHRAGSAVGQHWSRALRGRGAVWGGDWGNSLLGCLSANTFHCDAAVAGAKEQVGGCQRPEPRQEPAVVRGLGRT